MPGFLRKLFLSQLGIWAKNRIFEFSEEQVNMLSAIQIAGYLYQVFLQGNSMKNHVNTNSQKLKVDWKVFGEAWLKNM